MSFAILYLFKGEPFILMVLLVAVVTKNNHVVIDAIRGIIINMMNCQYLNSPDTTNSTSIISLRI